MITRKIVGTAVLTVCVLLPIIIIFISSLIEAIKDVIKFGDLSNLFFLFWLIAILVSFGLIIL